jgi:hypothetical protein
MALRDWQIALAQLVEARSAGREELPLRQADLELEGAERAWLEQVTGTPGFALTSYVPGRWRETRVGYTAPLTLAALGADARARLQDYQRAVPNFTLFFPSEGIAFLEYVDTLAVPTHVHTVARFERAMWNLKRRVLSMSAPTPAVPRDALLVRNPDAAVIPFDVHPELLLGALLMGAPLPEPTAELHHVLVAPGLPGSWRPATNQEARVFLACEPAMTLGALQSLSGGSPDIVDGLLCAQALSWGTPPAPATETQCGTTTS